MNGSVEIPLGHGLVATIDASDAVNVSQHKWNARRRANTTTIYAQTRIGGRTVLLHRFLMTPGPTNPVDHRDGDGLNNRRDNLRLATHTQNMRNRKRASNNASGFKGVYLVRSNKWRAQLKKDGRKVLQKYFTDPVQAARAYDEAAREHFGEFARCNFDN